MVFKFITPTAHELVASTLAANSLSNGLYRRLHSDAKNLANKITSNDLVAVDLGCPPEFAYEFKHHYLGVFLIMYPAFSNDLMSKKCSKRTLGSLSFSEAFAAMVDTSAGLAICTTSPFSDEAEDGLFLKSGLACVVCVWFFFLVIARV